MDAASGVGEPSDKVTKTNADAPASFKCDVWKDFGFSMKAMRKDARRLVFAHIVRFKVQLFSKHQLNLILQVFIRLFKSYCKKYQTALLYSEILMLLHIQFLLTEEETIKMSSRNTEYLIFFLLLYSVAFH